MKTAAEGTQTPIKILTCWLVRQELFILLHVFLVFDGLEKIEQLVVQTAQFANLPANVVDGPDNVITFIIFEGAVLREGAVQLA